jgi:hypothetical protein
MTPVRPRSPWPYVGSHLHAIVYRIDASYAELYHRGRSPMLHLR